MIKLFTKEWSFPVCAAGFALLLLLYMYLLDEPISIQNAVSAVADYGEEALEARALPGNPPPLNYATGFAIGVLFGGFAGALAAKKFKLSLKMEGRSLLKTAVSGVVGGALVMLGGLMVGDIFIGQVACAIQLSGGALFYLGAALLTAMAAGIFMANTANKGENSGKDAEGGQK